MDVEQCCLILNGKTEALSLAFTWAVTPQGSIYWNNIDKGDAMMVWGDYEFVDSLIGGFYKNDCGQAPIVFNESITDISNLSVWFDFSSTKQGHVYWMGNCRMFDTFGRILPYAARCLRAWGLTKDLKPGISPSKQIDYSAITSSIVGGR